MVYLVVVVVLLIQNIKGSLINSSCKKTKDWKNYDCQCPINHTIYIKHHVIEDGFQRLSPIDIVLGCNTTNAVYCGIQFPVNHRTERNNSAFASAVKMCNGKNRCNLSNEYFQTMETSLRKSCKDSKRPGLQNASFRQSIVYECIQDYQVVDTCVCRKDTRSPQIYLQSTGNKGNCSCHISGDVSRVEILQTVMVELMMSDNGILHYEHQNYNVDLYGVKVPPSKEKLLVKIKTHSTESRVLIKVAGNVTFYCMKEELTANTNENSQSINDSESLLNCTSMENSTSTLLSTADLNTAAISKSSYSGNINPKNGGTTTSKMRKGDNSSNDKAEIRSLVLIFTAIMLLVIFLFLCSVIQRRKDRDLLKAIFHRLEEIDSDTRVQRTEITSQVQRSESNRNYQEIPLQFLNHPRVKSINNAVYESGTSNQENANGDNEQDVNSLANSLGAQSDRFLLENDNGKGVYELQKQIEI
ncbi:uncharacterized protein LOC125663858 isoform X2 [Ostrea edulis]|uniref:uncharacterized protein LOC125663858 isoform X2 n=1 Tax=Ostrea edulis TaxID=37623 RepID=UPI0024AF1C65|nr:uncharacterized protein LOC125663858 isoform X2 [Ostrea edulis]